MGRMPADIKTNARTEAQRGSNSRPERRVAGLFATYPSHRVCNIRRLRIGLRPTQRGETFADVFPRLILDHEYHVFEGNAACRLSKRPALAANLDIDQPRRAFAIIDQKSRRANIEGMIARIDPIAHLAGCCGGDIARQFDIFRSVERRLENAERHPQTGVHYDISA